MAIEAEEEPKKVYYVGSCEKDVNKFPDDVAADIASAIDIGRARRRAGQLQTDEIGWSRRLRNP